MSQRILERMMYAEAKGSINPGMATPATFVILAEMGLKAAMEGYHGKKRVDEAITATKTEQAAMDASEALIKDIRELVKVKKAVRGGIAPGATHTTADFPIALANLRARQVRESYAGEDSQWRDFARVITVPDYKPIRWLKFNEVPGLLLRPEGTDVQYMTTGEAEGGYRIYNYERAIKYTWEMWRNDDIGLFTALLASFGRAARRIEIEVVLKAIDVGLGRTTLPTNGPGAPNIARLQEMEEILNARGFTNGEGLTVPYGYNLTDLIHSSADRIPVNNVLTTQYVQFQGGPQNPMFGAFDPHREPLWGQYLGRDYVGYDDNVDWLEVAFLDGFQAGPKTYTKVPTSQDYPEEGSFEDHTLHIKMGHALGASVLDTNGAIRVQGA